MPRAPHADPVLTSWVTVSLRQGVGSDPLGESPGRVLSQEPGWPVCPGTLKGTGAGAQGQEEDSLVQEAERPLCESSPCSAPFSQGY